MSLKGYKQSEEHKKKIADAQRGQKRKPLTLGHKLKISLGCKGKTGHPASLKQIEVAKINFAKSHTPEIQQKRTKTRLNNGKPWHSDETRAKMVANHLGSTGKHWKYPWDKAKFKGTVNGYAILHKWVRETFGKPTKCEKCGKEATGHKMNWANKSQEYKKERNDWMQLCPSCHAYYDLNFIKN